MLSVAVLVALAVYVLAAVWLARRPARGHLAASRWAREHLGPPARALAERLSVDAVAVLGLLGGFLLIAGLGAGFAKVLDDVLEGDGINVVDEPATQWLVGHREPWLSSAMKAVTHLGDSPVIAAAGLLICAWVAWRSQRLLPAALGVVGIAGIGLIILVAKAAVARPRPATPFALVSEDGFSFPSGHATGTAAIALLSAWLITRWLVRQWSIRVAVWATAVGIIGAVGFSRVYLGVHYVSDVLAGWLLGAAWAATVILVGSWWENSRTGESRLSARAPKT